MDLTHTLVRSAVSFFPIMVKLFYKNIVVRGADLSEHFFRLFPLFKCDFVHDDHPNWLLNFFVNKTLSENKSWKSSRMFYEKKLQHQRQTLEIVEDFACEAKFLHFYIFSKNFSCFSFFLCSFFFPLFFFLLFFCFSFVSIFHFSFLCFFFFHFFIFFIFFIFLHFFMFLHFFFFSTMFSSFF